MRNSSDKDAPHFSRGGSSVAATLVLSIGQQSTDLFELQETSCGLDYQHTLTGAIELRKQCNNAAFRDSCQVYTINFDYLSDNLLACYTCRQSVHFCSYIIVLYNKTDMHATEFEMELATKN